MSTGQRVRLRVITPVGICAILALSACERLPGFHRGEVQAPDRYSTVAPVPHPSRARGLSFQDPVYNRLQARALRDNLSLAEANERMREAEAAVQRNGSRLSGNATTDLSRSTGSGWLAGLGFNTTLDVFGRRAAAREAASSRLEASRQGALDAQRLVLAELARAYVDLRYYQQVRYHRQQELKGQMSLLRDLQAQLDEGEATRIDIAEARARNAEVQVQIPELDATIARIRNQISSLLGQPAGGLAQELTFTGQQPVPKAVGPLGIPADMVRARPDVQRAERLYAAAISDIDAAEAARYPQLSLSGSIRAPLSGGGFTDSLAASLAFPIFSQNELKADVRSAHSRANQAYLQWRSAVLVAVEEVETNLVAMQTGFRSVEAAGQAVSHNKQSLALTRELIENDGDATVLDVLEWERKVAESQVVLAERRRSLALSYIALRAALAFDEPTTGVK